MTMLLYRQRTGAAAAAVGLAVLAAAIWVAWAQEPASEDGAPAPPTLAEMREAVAAETTDPVADADDTERFVLNFRFIGGWWRGQDAKPSFAAILGHPRGEVPPPISREQFFDNQVLTGIANESGKLDVRVSPVYSLVCSAEMRGRAELKAPDRYFSWEARARRVLGETVSLDLWWNPRKGPRTTDDFFASRYFHRADRGELKTGLQMRTECTVGEARCCLCLGPGPEGSDLLICYVLVDEAWP